MVRHLDQNGLADRWLISPRTLEQWRWQGRGPRYLKLCGHVVYRISDIEAFEAAALHHNTAGPIDTMSEKEPFDGAADTIAKTLYGSKSGSGPTACHPAHDVRTAGGRRAGS